MSKAKTDATLEEAWCRIRPCQNLHATCKYTLKPEQGLVVLWGLVLSLFMCLVSVIRKHICQTTAQSFVQSGFGRGSGKQGLKL